MRRARTVWVPAGTPPIVNEPSAPDTAPRRVPSTKTLTSATPCCVAASTTRPVIVPVGACAPSLIDQNRPITSARAKRRTTAIRDPPRVWVGLERFLERFADARTPPIGLDRNRRGLVPADLIRPPK